jgi:hypothetical protein
MELITGLPAELMTVPVGPNRPDDPEFEQKRDAWERWGADLVRYRMQTVKAAVAHPRLAQLEWRKCANDPAYFIAVYGYLYEPRRRGKRSGTIPWIPFERQVQMIRWWQACMAAEDESADGVVSKSRDMGASWMMCALQIWGWLFVEPFNSLNISLKEEAVDSRMPKSLFWKIDKFLSYLPDYLMPPGFNHTQHRMKMWLRNPSNDNTITGESTNANSARADRATMILFDEAALIPQFLYVYGSASESSDHRFVVSTENMEHGTDFYNLARGIDMDEQPSPFPMEYYEHPLHDSEWLENRRKKIPNSEDFEREIMRNPFGASYYVYPPAREKSPDPDIQYVPGSTLYCSIDPGFDDATAIIWVQFNHHASRWEVINGYTNEKMPAAFYAGILAGTVVDLDGNPLEDGFSYTDYDEEVMAWVRSVGSEKFTYVGDMAGEQRNMAARNADSVYSVIRELVDIRVLADRTPTGKSSAYRMESRTHKGRREALKWLLPRLEFGDTVGARQALSALQNNRFSNSRTGRIPESGMFRDGTTHFTSALEYWAVNIKADHDMSSFYESRAERQKARTDKLTGSRISRMGRYTGVR